MVVVFNGVIVQDGAEQREEHVGAQTYDKYRPVFTETHLNTLTSRDYRAYYCQGQTSRSELDNSSTYYIIRATGGLNG